VTMKVTSKKKRARTGSQRRRGRGKGRSHSKSARMPRVGKRRGTLRRAVSGKARPAERRRRATRGADAEKKTPAAVKAGAGVVFSAVPVPGHEPESRGAPPPLPTPIATFNI